MGMDFRRDMDLVEGNVTESAKAAGVSGQKEIWVEAFQFEHGKAILRGATERERFSDMTKRWIHSSKVPWWAAFILMGVGVFL
jgi:hypothetical protein